MIDRLPPQSIEAEQSVLGSILIDRDAVIEVAEFLGPRTSIARRTAKIYAAMLDLLERREPIDIVTVAEALERSGDLEAIGGRAYLGTLSNETPTAVHADAVRPDRRAQGAAPEPDRGGRARSPASGTRIRPRSRRRSTAPRRSCSP